MPVNRLSNTIYVSRVSPERKKMPKKTKHILAKTGYGGQLLYSLRLDQPLSSNLLKNYFPVKLIISEDACANISVMHIARMMNIDII